MKRNKIYLILTLTLAIVAAVLLLTRNNSTLKAKQRDFAIQDTAAVLRVFLADKNGNQLELSRIPGKGWKVNQEFDVRKDAIDILLKTMLNVDIMSPVPKTTRNTIIKRLAAAAVKVEIYQQAYRINLFNRLRLFSYEKKAKVYYVGSSTQDNIGTYMIMEGSDIPYVTYIPGFRGFISGRFSPVQEDWRDHTVFATPISDIQSVSIQFVEVPGFSFEVTKAGQRAFSLKSLYTGKLVQDFDTLGILEFLSAFSNMKYETLVTKIDPAKKDSLLASKPFHVITLTEVTGKVHTLTTWHRAHPGGDTDEREVYSPYDPDRLYAVLGETNELVLIQFFVFDYILRPIGDYMKKPGIPVQ